jgi:hypothetical protein
VFEDSPISHLNSKDHKKIKEELQTVKNDDDLNFSIVRLHSQPGDISEELQKEKEESMKIKFRKIKQ